MNSLDVQELFIHYMYRDYESRRVYFYEIRPENEEMHEETRNRSKGWKIRFKFIRNVFALHDYLAELSVAKIN